MSLYYLPANPRANYGFSLTNPTSLLLNTSTVPTISYDPYTSSASSASTMITMIRCNASFRLSQYCIALDGRDWGAGGQAAFSWGNFAKRIRGCAHKDLFILHRVGNVGRETDEISPPRKENNVDARVKQPRAG